MEIKDIKPKYRIGDTFRRIRTWVYSWWKVEEIVYGVIEPIYTLRMMPSGNYIHEVGESELCESWYSTTINNL